MVTVRTRVDDAVEYIKLLGAGILLIKLHLESAYRHIYIHPSD